ncbi:MAG: class I adenylate cyclase [Spirochaetes bacterium]|jgi:adenylate cyclase class 1|nr:class I adenylate cyclase [Spirochaetota bacterium]
MEQDLLAQILAEIETNKGKFLKYNQKKLNTLYESISDPKKIELFESIPFLLNTNQTELPGYVDSSSVPLGIYNYHPTTKGINFVKAKFPTVQTMILRNDKPFVQTFALMGSAGTIAYTKDSDFDFWICFNEKDFNQESVALFKAKCRNIEAWIHEKFSMDVNFFLNAIEKVRKNIYAEDEKEDLFGTSIGELLKEEFFRSSIILHGKIPFWWVLPPECNDALYGQWLKVANESRIMHEYADLGNLYNIKREDFLVAALFQILKSLDSPFKSIIKMGLLERYLDSTEDNPFISNIIKKNIQEDKLQSEYIDAYIIMFNYLYDYFIQREDEKSVLEILKISFYLKSEPNLSRYFSAEAEGYISEKHRIMTEYAKKWNWSELTIKQMDAFQNWGIEPVTKLFNSAKKNMLLGYKKILSMIESKQIQHKMNEAEIKGITRKIFSHFSMSENKIDNTLSFKNYPFEKYLMMEYVRDRDGNDMWMLSKRLITNNKLNKIIIYKNKSLFGLVAWVSLNGLFQKDFTRLDIDSGLFSADPNFLRDIVADITNRFVINRVKLYNRYFLRDPFPIMSYIIINPFSKYSDKIDDIIFLYYNSWGEVKFDTYKNQNDFIKILADILNGCMITGLDFKTAINISSSSPYSSSKEFYQFRLLLKDIYDFFLEPMADEKRRYITQLGNRFVVFFTRKVGTVNVVDYTVFDSEIKLLYNISFNNGVRNKIRVDSGVKELNYLMKIIESYRENVIQIYSELETKYCYFFVTDERGSISFFRKPAVFYSQYLLGIYLFSMNVAGQIVANNPDSILAGQKMPIVMYNLKRGFKSDCEISEYDPVQMKKIFENLKKILPFKLSIRFNDEGEVLYRFSLPDGAFTDVLDKNNLMEVVGELKGLISSVQGYHYFVTDINLEHLSMNLYKNYTSFSFTEKNRFELMVERGLGE